jgi:hypothetical protein
MDVQLSVPDALYHYPPEVLALRAQLEELIAQERMLSEEIAKAKDNKSLQGKLGYEISQTRKGILKLTEQLKEVGPLKLSARYLRDEILAELETMLTRARAFRENFFRTNKDRPLDELYSEMETLIYMEARAVMALTAQELLRKQRSYNLLAVVSTLGDLFALWKEDVIRYTMQSHNPTDFEFYAIKAKAEFVQGYALSEVFHAVRRARESLDRGAVEFDDVEVLPEEAVV